MDEFGPYGIPLVHPIRLHYFLSKKNTRQTKEIKEVSQLITLKESKRNNEALIYSTKIFDDDQGSLLSYNIIVNPNDSSKVTISI